MFHARNLIMKALWNKICRIFGKNKDSMSTATRENIERKEDTGNWFSNNFLVRVLLGDTQQPLVSKELAEVLSDDDLSDEFNKQMMDENVREVVLTKGEKTYKFIK